MADLLSLPNELLTNIYTHIATLQSAACLSAANKRMYAIWLRDTDRIADCIVRRQIPAHERAIELAILEETWSEDNTPPLPIDNKPPIRLYGRRLLRIADYASVAIAEWDRQLDECPPDDDLENRRPCSVTNERSPYAAFYLIRKIIFSLGYPDHAQLQNSIKLAIDANSSHSEISTHFILSEFLLNACPDYCELQNRTLRREGKDTIGPRTGEDDESEDEMEDEIGMTIDDQQWCHVENTLGIWAGFDKPEDEMSDRQDETDNEGFGETISDDTGSI